MFTRRDLPRPGPSEGGIIRGIRSDFYPQYVFEDKDKEKYRYKYKSERVFKDKYKDKDKDKSERGLRSVCMARDLARPGPSEGGIIRGIRSD